MRQTMTGAIESPAGTLDPEVVEFRSHFHGTSPLDELVRTGARRGPLGDRVLPQLELEFSFAVR